MPLPWCVSFFRTFLLLNPSLFEMKKTTLGRGFRSKSLFPITVWAAVGLFLAFCIPSGLLAQVSIDFESYTEGAPVPYSCDPLETSWTYCGTCPLDNCYIITSSDVAHSGSLSGEIPENWEVNMYFRFGNLIFGKYQILFYLYVPSGNEASWSLIDESETTPIAFLFNPNNTTAGEGLVQDTALGDVSFTFPQDQWFPVAMVVDISTGISLSTWSFCVDGIEVIPSGTSFSNTGNMTSLGAMHFYNNTAATRYYIDDFVFDVTSIDNSCDLLGVPNVLTSSIQIYPNPVANILYLETPVPPKGVKVFNLLGKQLLEQKGPVDQLDLSNLPSGLLFVEIQTEEGSVVKKVVKE